MTDDEEYELQPATVFMLGEFEKGGEAFLTRGDNAGISKAVEALDTLDDYAKGTVIIDLLVLLATAMRTLQEQQLPLDPFNG